MRKTISLIMLIVILFSVEGGTFADNLKIKDLPVVDSKSEVKTIEENFKIKVDPNNEVEIKSVLETLDLQEETKKYIMDISQKCINGEIETQHIYISINNPAENGEVVNFSSINKLESNANTRALGKPYKGYKGRMYRDEIVSTSASSPYQTIYSGSKIANYFDTTTKNLLTLGIDGVIDVKTYGIWSIGKIIFNGVVISNVNSTSYFKHEAKIRNNISHKFTYILEQDNQLYLGCRSIKGNYTFTNSLDIPSKSRVVNTVSPTTNFTSPAWSNADEKAWQWRYNPWIESVKGVNYGGKNFTISY